MYIIKKNRGLFNLMNINADQLKLIIDAISAYTPDEKEEIRSSCKIERILCSKCDQGVCVRSFFVERTNLFEFIRFLSCAIRKISNDFDIESVGRNCVKISCKRGITPEEVRKIQHLIDGLK